MIARPPAPDPNVPASTIALLESESERVLTRIVPAGPPPLAAAVSADRRVPSPSSVSDRASTLTFPPGPDPAVSTEIDPPFCKRTSPVRRNVISPAAPGVFSTVAAKTPVFVASDPRIRTWSARTSTAPPFPFPPSTVAEMIPPSDTVSDRARTETSPLFPVEPASTRLPMTAPRRTVKLSATTDTRPPLPLPDVSQRMDALSRSEIEGLTMLMRPASPPPTGEEVATAKPVLSPRKKTVCFAVTSMLPPVPAPAVPAVTPAPFVTDSVSTLSRILPARPSPVVAAVTMEVSVSVIAPTSRRIAPPGPPVAARLCASITVPKSRIVSESATM